MAPLPKKTAKVHSPVKFTKLSNECPTDIIDTTETALEFIIQEEMKNTRTKIEKKFMMSDSKKIWYMTDEERIALQKKYESIGASEFICGLTMGLSMVFLIGLIARNIGFSNGFEEGAKQQRDLVSKHFAAKGIDISFIKNT